MDVVGRGHEEVGAERGDGGQVGGDGEKDSAEEGVSGDGLLVLGVGGGAVRDGGEEGGDGLDDEADVGERDLDHLAVLPAFNGRERLEEVGATGDDDGEGLAERGSVAEEETGGALLGGGAAVDLRGRRDLGW